MESHPIDQNLSFSLADHRGAVSRLVCRGILWQGLSTGHMHVVIGFRRQTAESVEYHSHNVVISHAGCIVWLARSTEIRYPVNRDFPPSLNGCPTIFYVPSLWARHSTPVIARLAGLLDRYREYLPGV